MKRSEVRAFIESGVTALGDAFKFGNGRITEFNKDRAKEYPFIWLESLEVDTDLMETGTPFDSWRIALHVAQKDQPDSIQDQYEPIVDQCDEFAQQLIKQYNALVSGYHLVTLAGIQRVPFIHKHADDTSGVILTFVLRSPDTTNVC